MLGNHGWGYRTGTLCLCNTLEDTKNSQHLEHQGISTEPSPTIKGSWRLTYQPTMTYNQAIQYESKCYLTYRGHIIPHRL